MTSIPNKQTLLLALILCLSACGSSESTRARTDARADPATATQEDAGENASHAEDEHEEGRRIELTEDAALAAGIELAEAGPARIRQVLPLYGVVKPNAERVREATARYPGVIRSVTKAVGDSVRHGEVLATVESNESLQTYSVTAPLTGVVTARNVNPGEYAGETALFTVADLANVWVELALFPRDLSKVRVGQTVLVKAVDGDLSADGKVVYVAPFGESASQTLNARVLLANAEGRWAPGFYVTGEVALSETEALVAVKSTALQTIEDETVVFVHKDESFIPQPVAVGQSDNEYTEVRAGLAPGARYAASNSFVLKSELGKGEAGHEH